MGEGRSRSKGSELWKQPPQAVDLRAVQPAAEVLEGQASIVQRGIRQDLVKKPSHIWFPVRQSADQGLGEKD